MSTKKISYCGECRDSKNDIIQLGVIEESYDDKGKLIERTCTAGGCPRTNCPYKLFKKGE